MTTARPWQWWLFSLLVGVNQGAVTLMLALASSVVGERNAGVQSGLLFAMYTGSALLVAVPLVRTLGAKWTACASLVAQSFYIGAYLLALVVGQSAAFGACLVGSSIGGLSTGCLWTAQGTYFALFAKAHAQHARVAPEQATATLASQFAAGFLFVEVCAANAANAARTRAGAGGVRRAESGGAHTMGPCA
jgi:hypothetical protein